MTLGKVVVVAFRCDALVDLHLAIWGSPNLGDGVVLKAVPQCRGAGNSPGSDGRATCQFFYRLHRSFCKWNFFF
jgi:hypothetical protein